MRGYKKRIIYVTNADCDDLNNTFFVLKSNKNKEKDNKNFTRDMVSEANRVIDEKIGSDKKRRITLILTATVSFLFGALISMSAATVLILCLV